MKKAKVRTRYMIPIFLWSVVVTHDVQPPGSGRTSRAVTIPTGLAAVGGGGLTVAAMVQGVVFSNCLRCTAAASSAALMSVLRVASHVSKFCGVSAWTVATIFAWLRPHSSAHCPVKVLPARRPGILNQVWFV